MSIIKKLVSPVTLLISLAMVLSSFLTPYLSALHPDREEVPVVLVIEIEDIINPVKVEFISRAIEEASKMRAEAIVIKMDTPGGLVTSAKSIVKEFLGSPVPVVVYVYPSGAGAISAGVFITMAGHVAAMSPGTAIGAAHPVGVVGKDEAAIEKIVSVLATYIRTIADERERNADWGEAAVRENVIATDSEALELDVIDLIATDLGSLLSEIDGKKVAVDDEEWILKTEDAKVVEKEMGLGLMILDVIGHPNVAHILMAIGMYGIFFELMNPGAIFPGTIGVISLILAFFAFQIVPVDFAGILLMLVGIALFVFEAKTPTYGLLAIGGLISFILGSIMAFPSPYPFLRVSLEVVIPVAIVTAIFFVFTGTLALQAYRRRPITGIEGLKGREGVASTDITPTGGMVSVGGETWSAYSDDVIPKKTKVVVEEFKGLKVKVRRESPKKTL